MKILVTGGAGFIGSHLCSHLLKAGHQVVALDNLITGSKENLKDKLKNPQFRFIKHDITRPLSLSMDLPSIDQIYHLACPTGVDNIFSLAKEMLLTSAIGTKNVLELAERCSAQILFTSSSEAYGNPKIFPQSENYNGNVSTVDFRSPYEEGKRFAESLTVMYVRKYNLDAKIVRLFNVYGPLMSSKDSRVIPSFISQIKKDEVLMVTGNGSQTRTFCYVDDIVRGLILILNKGEKGEVYNLGSDKEITILELAKIIIAKTNHNRQVKFVKRPDHDHERRLPSLLKVKKLGWEPKVSLDEGLKRMLLWSGF